MRTTIRLHDDLYRRVRVTAAADGSTITSFIEDALREALRRAGDSGLPDSYSVEPFDGDGVRPGVDLDDNAALFDLMDAG